jgi:hypothetical protein
MSATTCRLFATFRFNGSLRRKEPGTGGGSGDGSGSGDGDGSSSGRAGPLGVNQLFAMSTNRL